MKSKLTFLAATIAALVFVSSAAFASGTRMASMGLTGAEPMIQKDSSQWSWNPATIALFPGLITVYWDSARNQNGGGKLLVKPIAGVEFYSLISADYTSTGYTSANASSEPLFPSLWHMGAYSGGLPEFITNNPAATASAINIAESKPPTPAVMMATATFAYTHSNISYGLEGSFAYCAEDSDSAMDWKVKAGVFAPITASMSVDATFSFGMPMLDQVGDFAGGKYSYVTDNAYDLYAYARFNWQAAETQNIHIFAKYSGFDHSTYYTQKATDTNLDLIRKGHRIQIGFSDEMNFSKTSLVYVGLDFNILMDQYNYDGDVGATGLTKLEADMTAYTLALRMGAEGRIIGGLGGRVGVVHDIMLQDVNNITGAQTSGGSSRYPDADHQYNYRTNASLGLVYKIGNFTIEGTLNKALFTTGPYFISGQQNDLSGSITLIYFFGGDPITGGVPAGAAQQNEEK